MEDGAEEAAWTLRSITSLSGSPLECCFSSHKTVGTPSEKWYLSGWPTVPSLVLASGITEGCGLSVNNWRQEMRKEAAI